MDNNKIGKYRLVARAFVFADETGTIRRLIPCSRSPWRDTPTDGNIPAVGKDTALRPGREEGGRHAPVHDEVGYTPETVAALTRNPEDRSEAFGRLADSMGGRLVSFDYTFGEYDVLVIYEAPDEGTAAAMVMAAVSPGHLSSAKTTVLLSAEEGIEAMRKAGEATYRGPH